LTDQKLNKALLSLFELGRDAMFITDERGFITHVNPAFLGRYVFSKEEAIGKRMGTMLKNPLLQTYDFKIILKHVLSHNTWKGELPMMAKSGEIITAWTHIVRVDHGFAVLLIDLTDRDKITRQMEGLSRLQSVTTLAGGIAHEFNNILAGIQGHLYLVKRRLQDEKELDRMQRIDGLMQRAASLVYNLLTFSKQKKNNLKEVTLLPVLEEVIELTKKTMDAHIVISLSVKERGIIIYADPVVFKQHIFELITNAEDAILEQRRMGANTKGVEHINIQLGLAENGMAEILVRDNGMGMQSATLAHCLEPFFTTKPVGQGSGLGLSSVVAYMHDIKGTLSVESVYGEYTTMRIHVPLAVQMAERTTRQGLVLLVDDDDGFRQSIGEILSYHGYEVLTASNGLDALGMWRQYANKIDAVVMDIIMPSMDGLEVAQEIRRDDAHVPVCLTTGYTQQRVPVSLGVNLLRKPMNPDVLIEYLERSIRKRDS